MKERDTFTEVSASDDFLIVRLNTLPNSVQRTMGLVLFDNNDVSIIYASGHDMLPRPLLCLSGENSSITRGSTGVYCGSARDIDDFTKFNCVFDSSEPCFYFQKISNSGQRGHLGIDISGIWHEEKLNSRIMYYYGSCGNM